MEPADQDLLWVLVIDDDPDLRNLYVRQLLSEGHQVFAVGSAEEGLALLPYHTFHVAFIDQNLPAMDGLVVGEYLRKNNPHMQIALVTGSEEERLDRLAAELCIRVIRKPFTQSQLLDLVSDYRREAEDRRAQRLSREDPDYEPPVARYFDDVSDAFEIPGVPQRIEDRIVKTVRQSLTELRSVSRYNERDRVLAFAGLVSLSVLGIKAPKGAEGRTLYQEYDDVMRAQGRRPEFSMQTESDEEE